MSDYPSDVVADGEDHQADDQCHADQLGCHEELLAGLASAHHLVEGEQDMASVESGDGNEVDHREHYGQQCENVQETVPVPDGREHLAYLISYLSADLREKPSGSPKKTQADHLPTFMKTAKNRERIVKLLKKLQEG